MTSDIGSVVVLAAGQGKRMRSKLPKVLHRVCGRPMLLHVLDAVRAVGAERIVIVLGHGYEQVLPIVPPDCLVALQEQQLGTGHAVLAAGEHILPGAFLVLPGDTPLVTGEALQTLVRDHVESAAQATVLTMELNDPTGYGRIARDAAGSVRSIVEHRDATPEELAIREVNSGMYVLTAPLALEVLAEVGAENDQCEIYLTDVIAGLRDRGAKVGASKVGDASLVLGVNSQEELATADLIMQARLEAERKTGVREQ
ncbi:MAG: NTP transferase domain-containing protein [Thermoleophilia bacterium]|nr:NTP transferase domain-containing protein [Thermoleophilia bacterium]